LRVKPDGFPSAAPYDRSMSRRDKATLALLGFFFLIAFTIELYYVIAHDRIVAEAGRNPLAWLLAIYGQSDRAYFDAPSPLTITLEGFNVVVTQPLGIALALAIWRRRDWRWPLQLAVGAYVTYSVVLYFAIAHVSGMAGMRDRSVRSFAIFYGANLPWLGGYTWLMWDAAREIRKRLARASAPAIVEPDRVAPVVEQLGEQAAEVEARRERGDDRERAESLSP
jgi:hypothetical protein